MATETGGGAMATWCHERLSGLGSAFDAPSLTFVLPTDNIPSHLQCSHLQYKVKKQIHGLSMELKNGGTPARYANPGIPSQRCG
jgi:hypothetical protein